MKYDVKINGLPVNAEYSKKAIDTILLPLLQRLTSLQKEKDGRVLAILAAPPGAGKSTLLSFLKYLSKSVEGLSPITTIGMDGFHHYQDYLLSHTITRDGADIPMVKIKGAPVTFDLPLLTERIARVAAGEVCGWPEYDRLKHNPAEDAITVTGDIVLLEGNYLLLDEPGWREIRNYADYTIKLTADEEILRNRLIERKILTGVDRQSAEQFVDFSDMVNVRTCLQKPLDADLVIDITSF